MKPSLDQPGPRAVGIWIRVSTEDQARGESPEHHEKRALSYAEAKGWRVAEVYRLEAVSGKAVMGHPEAKRMLADLRAGHISALVFSKLARLARNTRELLDFSEIFRAENADLVSLQESIDTSSPAGRLFFTMIAAMAEWEREEITERVRASVPIRAKLGKSLGGAAPFGYRWRDKRLEPDPNEAPVRVLIHELFVEHKRKKTVARILNDRGYRTRRGSRFSDTTLANLLSDPTAKGLHRANYTQTDDRSKTWKLKPESEWVYTEVEPIISVDLWGECARILAEQKAGRTPAKRASYLFAGVTYCACGPKMYVRAKSPKYVCETCRNKMPIEDLEAVYRNELHRFLISPADIEAQGRAANEMVAEKERLVASTEADIRKIDAEDQINFDLFRAGSISSDAFGRRHHPLEARRAELENELPRLQAELDVLRINVLSRDEVLGESQNLMRHWDDLSYEVKREIVETITTRIVIGTNDIDIELLQLPIAAIGDQKATRAQGFWAATSWTRAG